MTAKKSASVSQGARRTVPARARVKLTPGEVVRMTRELHDMSQARLAELTGMTQPTISGIEADRVVVGAGRAAKLAIALKVHPAIILWPNWEEEHDASIANVRAENVRARDVPRRARPRPAQPRSRPHLRAASS